MGIRFVPPVESDKVRVFHGGVESLHGRGGFKFDVFHIKIKNMAMLLGQLWQPVLVSPGPGYGFASFHSCSNY
jgi:hypothetical protein